MTVDSPLEHTPDRRKVEALALRYALALPDRQKASRAGELAGRRTGSSVEFQDRKDYTLGDDLRYIDWRGYARNDRLTVKLFREEITPVIDIFVDCSASMSVTPAKSRLRIELGYLFALLANKLHASCHVHRVAARIEPLYVALDIDHERDERHESPLPMLMSTPAAQRPGIKIFISDLMFRFNPPELIRAFANADRLAVVQTLSAFEACPHDSGAFRLEDAETVEHLDLKLDKPTVEKYMRRLHGLMDEVDRRVKKVHGCFTTVDDEMTLEAACHKLLGAGILTV